MNFIRNFKQFSTRIQNMYSFRSLKKISRKSVSIMNNSLHRDHVMPYFTEIPSSRTSRLTSASNCFLTIACMPLNTKKVMNQSSESFFGQGLISIYLFQGIFYFFLMPVIMYYSPLPERGISVHIFNARINLQLLIYVVMISCKF